MEIIIKNTFLRFRQYQFNPITQVSVITVNTAKLGQSVYWNCNVPKLIHCSMMNFSYHEGFWLSGTNHKTSQSCGRKTPLEVELGINSENYKLLEIRRGVNCDNWCYLISEIFQEKNSVCNRLIPVHPYQTTLHNHKSLGLDSVNSSKPSEQLLFQLRNNLFRQFLGGSERCQERLFSRGRKWFMTTCQE